DAELADRDKQIAQFKSEIQSLRQQIQSSGAVADTKNPVKALDAAQVWRDPQHNEEFTFALLGCARKSQTVTCTFNVIADQRDRQIYLFGRSRLIDKEGKQSLAS